MAIKNGGLASADDVINNLGGQQFKNFAQLLYNAKYIGFNANLNKTGIPNLNNIKYNVSAFFTPITNSYYRSVDTQIYGYFQKLDFFNRGSFNIRNTSTTETNDIWTATTIDDPDYGEPRIIETSGDSGIMQLYTVFGDYTGSVTSTITANQASAPNLNQNCQLLFHIKTLSAGKSGSTTEDSNCYIYISLTDGSTTIPILTRIYNSSSNTTTGELINTGYYRIKIIPGANTATTYLPADIYTASSTIDISAYNLLNNKPVLSVALSLSLYLLS